MTTSSEALHVVMVSSEVVPFSKTGGLADVVGGLSSALARLGHEVSVITPLYGSVDRERLRPSAIELTVPLGDQVVLSDVWESRAGSRLTTLFLDVPEAFDRPGLYGERGVDYPDNARRFSLLCRGALQWLATQKRPPEIVHAHDWQAALMPLYLKSLLANDPRFAAMRSLLTVHNLAYQGLFDPAELTVTGLKPELFTPRYLEFFGSLSFLKGGIVAADALTTVSPTYAREILSADLGCGLEGVLQDRSEDLHGILNGIDTCEWSPETDEYLPVRYRAGAMQGKGKCKRALQEEFGLPVCSDRPLIGMVTRLVPQKGIDMFISAFADLLETGADWVVLGNGQPELERQLRVLAAAHPERLAVYIGFDNGKSHRVQGGCDYSLMPSRFEPCGLSQLYSLRYGTIPVVRAVGGLADTVIDVTSHPDSGTGICFDPPTTVALVDAVRRALALYRKPKVWASLRRRAMQMDFSWERSARSYVDLYKSVLGRPPTAVPPGP
jgi:starch synthase